VTQVALIEVGTLYRRCHGVSQSVWGSFIPSLSFFPQDVELGSSRIPMFADSVFPV